MSAYPGGQARREQAAGAGGAPGRGKGGTGGTHANCGHTAAGGAAVASTAGLDRVKDWLGFTGGAKP